MTATTACFLRLINKDCLDLAKRNDNLICSVDGDGGGVAGGVHQRFVVTYQGQDSGDSFAHLDYSDQPRFTYKPITSSTAAGDNRPMRGVKRQRSSYGSGMRPPPCKWIRIGSGDVISRTSDLEDRNIEQGASSGIPSPVDDDDKSNDSLEPNVFEDDDTMSHDYIPFYQYQAFSDMRNSVQNSWNVRNNVYDVFNSRLLSGHHPAGVQTPEHNVTRSEYSRNTGRKENCVNCLKSNVTVCHRGKTNGVNTENNGYISGPVPSLHTGRTMTDMEIDRTLIPTKTARTFMSDKWGRMLKAANGFLMVLRSDLTILYVSPNVSDCLGFHQNQLIGQTMVSFVHPSHHHLLRNVTCSNGRHKGERHDPVPGPRHTFPVDMRFEFHRDGHAMSSGFLAAQWFLRPRPSPRADNSSCNMNTVSIICLPYNTYYHLSRASQRTVQAILGRQDWNLFRTLHPANDLRNLVMKCPHSCCSLTTVVCLTCMESLLKAGCVMCICRAARSGRCINNWRVSFANTGTDRDNPKCVVCRSIDRTNETYSGEFKLLSKKTTYWKLSASARRIIFSQQSPYSTINHSENEMSQMTNDETFHPFHETSQTSSCDNSKTLFQSSQGNSEMSVEGVQCRLQQDTSQINDLTTKARNNEGKVCSFYAFPIQESQHLNHQTTKLTQNVCHEDHEDTMVNRNHISTVHTKLIEVLCEDDALQNVHTLQNSLSLPPMTINPTAFQQKSTTSAHTLVPVGNKPPKSMSTNIDSLEWYKDMANAQSSLSFMCEENQSNDLYQSSSFQIPDACHDINNEYKYLKYSSQVLEDGNIDSNSKLDQTADLNEMEQNQHWPMLQTHHLSHDVTNQPSNYPSLSLSSQENDTQNNQPLMCPPNDDMEGLEELDFTSEFAFPGSDVVMPVENGLECVNDLVLNSSNPNIVDGNPINNSIQIEGSLDPFTVPSSNEFTEPFDSFLTFSSSDFTPSSISSSNSISTSSTDKNMEFNECSNGYLVKPDGVVTQNKFPFIKHSEPVHQPTAQQNCYSTLLELFTPATGEKNQSKSLLRSLLKKDEVEEQTEPVPVPEWKQQSVQHSGLSQSYHSDDSKTTSRTKELPVPKNPSRRLHRHSCPSITTQELPLPSNVVSKPLAFKLFQNRSSSFDSCKSSEEDKDVENASCSNGNDVSAFTTCVNGDSQSMNMNGLLNGDEDTLPDDLLDLAIEYCSSMDNRHADSFMTDLNEPFSWDGNLDLLNSSNSIDSFCQTSSSSEPNSLQSILNSQNENPPLGIKNSSVHNGTKSSVCLPISNKLPPKTQTQTQPSPSTNKLASLLLPSAKMENCGSLLRQAVTSPDVDKLIQQIPLGRRLMLKKCRSSNHNKCDNKQDRDVNVHTLHQYLQPHEAGQRPALGQPICHELLAKDRHGSSNIECLKTSAVSHISISTPPNCPLKKSHFKPCVSPIKVKISSSSDIGRHRPSKNDSQNCCKKPTKTSNCPNSFSEPVSVMVMRKENHRARRCKTVAIQTDNNPDEVYPALELSPSDVYLTPSVYLDTSHSLPSPKSSTTRSKSPFNTCHSFLSPSRNPVSPKHSSNSTTSSPIFRHTSPSSSLSSSPSPSSSSSVSSSISELEQHLRSVISPSSKTPSSLSTGTEMSSGVPFLQRLLTGELSKDRYEKLDKDLLKRQRSNLIGADLSDC